MGRDLAQRAASQRNTPATADQKTLGQQIAEMQQEFQRAMPRGVEATQLVRDALTCLRSTPQLAACEASTVLGALMTCAQLGLRPGVAGLGHAWPLPMWSGKNRRMEATLVIGYKGYQELAYRHDKVISIASRVVYSNDDFRMVYGIDADVLEHTPCTTGTRGEPRLYYALARLQGGYALTEPWTQEDMEAHRDRYAMAKVKDRETGEKVIVGPWRDQFIEMGRKTMIRGPLVKMIPLSTELAQAIAVDEGVRVDLNPKSDPAEVTAPTMPGELESGPAELEAADAEAMAEAGLGDPTHYSEAEIAEGS
jgi:recombination protein RecT